MLDWAGEMRRLNGLRLCSIGFAVNSEPEWRYCYHQVDRWRNCRPARGLVFPVSLQKPEYHELGVGAQINLAVDHQRHFKDRAHANSIAGSGVVAGVELIGKVGGIKGI